MISLLLKESLTDTELRNVAALYNPMTLQELQNLFNMVGDLYYSFTGSCITSLTGLDSVF